jgi:type II secretory pathway pseudopilin PulG
MLRANKNPMRVRRAAFSLAELVISIGILILMMALAGQVFSITIKSTGQATALTEVTQQLRVFEETLREDLRNVQPGQSVMLIQSNPVNAYWTQLGKEADDNNDPSDGYGHLRDLEREKLKADGTPDVVSGYEKMVEPRADILTFFTARKANSFVNPLVSSRVQQVVYGHAEMGEYPADPAQPMVMSPPFPNLNESFPIPAQRWHLARRSILVIPAGISDESSWETIKGALPGGGGLGNIQLVEGRSDFVSDFRYEDLVVRPFDAKNNWGSKEPWFLPSVFGDTTGTALHIPYARSKLDPTPPMMMANRMGAYFLPNCASFKVEWSLDPRSTFVAGRLDGTSEVFWFDQGDGGDPDRETFTGADPLYSIQKRIEELDAKSDAASKNLMAQLVSLLCDPVVHADGDEYSLADRFRGVGCEDPDSGWEQLAPDGIRPNTAAFTATRPHVNASISEPAPDDIWPGALRITVDLYDRESRLERPIRHVMVIPIGG